MKNKKAEMLARDWVVSAILFSGVIALLVLQAGALVDEYDVSNVTSQDFSDKFDRFENNSDTAQEMWEQSSGEGGLSTVGTFDILFKSTFGVISLVFSSVTLAGSQMFGFTEYFGIPSEVGFLFFTILLSILSVIIVFIVISSVSRRDL